MILVEKSNNDAGDNLANVISNIKSIDTFSDDNYNNSFRILKRRIIPQRRRALSILLDKELVIPCLDSSCGYSILL
jgi:hypothetical protein